MSEPALRVGGGFMLLRNHAIVDYRGHLVMRLQLVNDAEAVRIFNAMIWCGVFNE